MNKILYIGGGIVVCIATAAYLFDPLESQSPGREKLKKHPVASLFNKQPDLVLHEGGSIDRVRTTIKLLDKANREKKRLSIVELEQVVSCLEAGRPNSCSNQEWQNFMNSAFNVITANFSIASGSEAINRRVSRLLPKMLVESKDEVIRNYVVQQISFWYEHSVEKDLLLEALKRASRDARDSAGSAVMVLADLLQKSLISSEQISSDEIAKVSFLLVKNREAANDVRISSLHTFITLKDTRVLPLAVEIVQDVTEHMTLRMAAIYTIGQMGNLDTHAEVLENISEKRLQSSASYALKALKK